MNPNTNAIARLILLISGSVLTTQGVTDQAGLDDLTNLLEMVIGGAIAVGSAFWSLWSKRPTSTEAKQIAAKVQGAQ